MILNLGKKNITTLVNFKEKWSSMVDKKTPIPTPEPNDLYSKQKNKHKKWNIGAYEPAGYSMHGVYRAFPDCRMRTNTNPEFCPICRKAITDVIDFYTK